MKGLSNPYFAISLIIILLVAGTVLFELTNIKIPAVNFIQNSIYNLINPFIDSITSMVRTIESYTTGLFRANEIVDEKKQLQRRVFELEDKVRKLKESKRQNERLKKIDDFLAVFKDFTEYEVQGASVIGYSPSSWNNRIILNKGTNDGIKEGMPVISYNGILVGQIKNAAIGSSQVLMVNDPEFAVGGIVQNSRTVGLIRGQVGNQEVNIMEKIPENDEISPDDRILTYSNNFPKYLPIGEVIEVNTNDYGISRIAEIELYINQHTIEEVVVITDY